MIHIFKEEDGSYQVWTDCESGEHKLGRCLATGSTPHEAIYKATAEVGDDLAALRTLAKMPTQELWNSALIAVCLWRRT